MERRLVYELGEAAKFMKRKLAPLRLRNFSSAQIEFINSGQRARGVQLEEKFLSAPNFLPDKESGPGQKMR